MVAKKESAEKKVSSKKVATSSKKTSIEKTASKKLKAEVKESVRESSKKLAITVLKKVGKSLKT